MRQKAIFSYFFIAAFLVAQIAAFILVGTDAVVKIVQWCKNRKKRKAIEIESPTRIKIIVCISIATGKS